MERFFYAVPVSSESTYLNGVKVSSILEEGYPEIYKSVQTKKALYENVVIDITEYNIVTSKLEKLFNLKFIPKYLIVCECDGVRYEVLSKSLVTTSKEADFESYEIPYDLAADLFQKSNYTKRFSLFFDTFMHLRHNEIVKSIEDEQIKRER